MCAQVLHIFIFLLINSICDSFQIELNGKSHLNLDKSDTLSTPVHLDILRVITKSATDGKDGEKLRSEIWDDQNQNYKFQIINNDEVLRSKPKVRFVRQIYHGYNSTSLKANYPLPSGNAQHRGPGYYNNTQYRGYPTYNPFNTSLPKVQNFTIFQNKTQGPFNNFSSSWLNLYPGFNTNSNTTRHHAALKPGTILGFGPRNTTLFSNSSYQREMTNYQSYPYKGGLSTFKNTSFVSSNNNHVGTNYAPHKYPAAPSNVSNISNVFNQTFGKNNNSSSPWLHLYPSFNSSSNISRHHTSLKPGVIIGFGPRNTTSMFNSSYIYPNNTIFSHQYSISPFRQQNPNMFVNQTSSGFKFDQQYLDINQSQAIAGTNRNYPGISEQLRHQYPLPNVYSNYPGYDPRNVTARHFSYP